MKPSFLQSGILKTLYRYLVKKSEKLTLKPALLMRQKIHPCHLQPLLLIFIHLLVTFFFLYPT